MKILILDDDTGRFDGAKWYLKAHEIEMEVFHAKDQHEFMTLLGQHDFDFISFDHDLGYQSPSGSVLADWLLREYEVKIPKKGVLVHSSNRSGALNIHSKFTSYFKVNPTYECPVRIIEISSDWALTIKELC